MGENAERLEIERLIRTLGISATYRGYHYLNYGIYLCLQNEDYLLSVSKLLYPQIANTYHTTSCNVERNIRTVIKICWDRGNRIFLQQIAMHTLEIRPTSSKFIDILVGHLKQT